MHYFSHCRIVYEIPDESQITEPTDTNSLSINSAFLWNYEVNVTVAHLRQTLEGFSSKDKRKLTFQRMSGQNTLFNKL